MDRAKVKKLREALTKAHEQVCREVGVSIRVGTIRFRDGQATMRLTALDTVQPAAGQPVKSAEEVAYEKYAKAAGLDVPLRTPFTVNGNTYRITGWVPSRYKFPVSAVSERGARYKFTVIQVQRGLGRAKRPDAAILEDLRRVECDLSPENVSGDGEYPRAYVQQRVSELNRKRTALVTELGREPTDEELYPDLYARRQKVM